MARYFQHVLTEGRPFIKTAKIIQTGDFCLRRGGSWNAMKAEQTFSTEPAGFLWNAQIRIVHMLDVQVRDAYSSGIGSMQAKILGFVPIMNQHGAPELNAAALQRYLGEAVWFPTELLPGNRLTWRALDDNNSAAVTIRDAGIEVSLEFHFNDACEVTDIFTAGRFRFVHGSWLTTPWICHLRNYAEIGSVRIPLEAEVEWLLPEGKFPYFKGRITNVEFDAALKNGTPHCSCS